MFRGVGEWAANVPIDSPFDMISFVGSLIVSVPRRRYFNPKAYLRSTNNAFDFMVVIITTIDMFLRMLAVDAQWVQVIRLTRTLRLVRLLEHVDGMAVMAQAIVQCIPSVSAIMVQHVTVFVTCFRPTMLIVSCA